MMGVLFQDLRYGLRMLAKSPGFTAVAVLTLALGIGANTAIFSLVNALLLRPLPYHDGNRLVVITEKTLQSPETPISYPNFLDWQTQNDAFERMAAFQPESLNITGVEVPENVGCLKVSASFFSTLGMKPILGRDFQPDDDAGGNPVVLMSHGWWQRRFGADQGIVGRKLTLKGTLKAQSYTVIGILPPDFKFYGEADLYVPIGLWRGDGYLMKRENHDRTLAVARLKPAVTMEYARAQMNTIASRLEKQYPTTNAGWGATVTPLRERIVGSVRPAALVLLCAVGFVLLIACVNIANLLLARSLARYKEVAIRVALGAGRWRLVRQLLTESLLLALAGGTLGILLTLWGIESLTGLIPEDLRHAVFGKITIDHRVLAFTLLVSLLTGIFFGLFPALPVSRPDLNEHLKEGERFSAARFERHRVRNFLVVCEVALAFVLLTGAGLLLRSFYRLLAVNPGFNPQNVVTIQLDTSDPKYDSNPAQFFAFNRQLLEHVQALPGVQHVGMVRPLPLGGGHSEMPFYLEGHPLPAQGQFPVTGWRGLSPGYFEAMGVPLLKGRFFAVSDNPNTPMVSVINESMARRYWPNEDPIGKRFRLGTSEMGLPWFIVVGVVGDTRPDGLAAGAPAEFYVSCLQLGSWADMSLVVKATSQPLQVAAAVREQVLALDKEMATSEPRSVDELLASSLAGRRVNALLLALFAAMALLLAGVGIYGVMSYAVTQRTHELGLRMALGAARLDIVKLVVGEGLILTLLGVAAGLAGAWGLTRFLRGMLFGTRPTDPVTYAGVSVVLVAVALLACYIPARRATKVGPMEALRYE
jgi:putative ABC transport system permease protein